MSVACLWYLLATANPHPNISEEQINFSQQSDLPKCLKWLQKALFVLFFGCFRSFSRLLNSREFKFTVAFELFAFATTWLSTKRISLVYVFHALFNRRSSNLFKLFLAKRGQHSESFQSSPNYKPHARLICVQ